VVIKMALELVSCNKRVEYLLKVKPRTCPALPQFYIVLSMVQARLSFRSPILFNSPQNVGIAQRQRKMRLNFRRAWKRGAFWHPIWHRATRDAAGLDGTVCQVYRPNHLIT
jgi:hypothetical protein